MKIQNMTRCALMATLMVLCAWIAVPVEELAVSLQTFGVFLALRILGGRLGTAAVAVYLGLGALGLPVFTGFQGGIGVLLGPTGGYLWGFAAAAAVWWALEKRLPDFMNMILGLAVCYACGAGWYFCFYARAGLVQILMICVVPYLIPDLLKLFLVMIVHSRLEKLRIWRKQPWN